MTAIGKLWTGAVAYISLLVGAGLSVAGNLADTYRTRGADIDNLDRVMAAGWPILVLLAIEMFVSPRWSPRPMFQIWRWVGCLAVGGMAMTVSWTHLHDLMATRGQLVIVAILGPLAIDGMAIMATGLILSTRVAMMATATGPSIGQSVAMAIDTLTSGQTYDGDGRGHGHVATVANPPVATVANPPVAMDELPDWPVDLANFDRDMDLAIQRGGQDMATDVEHYLAAATGDQLPPRVPVVPGPMDRSAAYRAVPLEARELLVNWDGETLAGVEVDTLLAAHFGRSERTARRWRTAVLGPASSPPAS